MLFGKDTLLPAIMQRLGLKITNGNSADNLVQYYNHDLTEKLTEILQVVQEGRNIDRASLQILKELKEYGIKCRIEK